MIDLGNCSQQLLGPGEEWVGTPSRITDQAQIQVVGLADVQGTLYVEYSLDGVTWPISQSHLVTGGNPYSGVVTIIGKWYRIRYRNGLTPQGLFLIVCNSHYSVVA